MEPRRRHPRVAKGRVEAPSVKLGAECCLAGVRNVRAWGDKMDNDNSSGANVPSRVRLVNTASLDELVRSSVRASAEGQEPARDRSEAEPGATLHALTPTLHEERSTIHAHEHAHAHESLAMDASQTSGSPRGARLSPRSSPHRRSSAACRRKHGLASRGESESTRPGAEAPRLRRTPKSPLRLACFSCSISARALTPNS